MSDSLRPHGLKHTRLPCLSPTPRACSNLCPSSDGIQPARPLSSISPPAFPSIRVFFNEPFFVSGGQHIGVSASASVLPVNIHSGLISFRIDWFDLLAVQETLKSLLQDNSSKASVLWCSAFFMDQLSHPHMTTGKGITLSRWTFVGKVMPLISNMLSRS